MGVSDSRYNGRIASLLQYVTLKTRPTPPRATWVKWISLSARPSLTDRRLSERMDNYLSSRCFIGRDYTLPEKDVKQYNLVITQKSEG